MSLIIMVTAVALAVMVTRPKRAAPPASFTSSEPVAGTADFASLFAHIDGNRFPESNYRDLITMFDDCITGPEHIFQNTVQIEELSEGKKTALRQFVLSGTVFTSIDSENASADSIHQVLSAASSNCETIVSP